MPHNNNTKTAIQLLYSLSGAMLVRPGDPVGLLVYSWVLGSRACLHYC